MVPGQDAVAEFAGIVGGSGDGEAGGEEETVGCFLHRCGHGGVCWRVNATLDVMFERFGKGGSETVRRIQRVGGGVHERGAGRGDGSGNP